MPPRSICSAELADTAQVAEQAQAMRRGERINISENRAVLHTALRAKRRRQAGAGRRRKRVAAHPP